MRIITYEDASVIIDELHIGLTYGYNTIVFQAPGYIPRTLYAITTYKYSISESTNITVQLGNHTLNGMILSLDEESITLQDIGIGGDWDIYSSDNGIYTGKYDSLQRISTEITLIIHVTSQVEEEVIIPIVYTTDMITGSISYVYDIQTGESYASLTLDNKMNENISAMIGIGAIPLYSDLDTGDDILEYSLLHEYTLKHNEETIIPLHIEFSLKYILDIQREEAYTLLNIERKSDKPPYPGILYICNGDDILSEQEITRELSMVNLNVTPDIQIEVNDSQIQISNDEGEYIPIVLITESDDYPVIEIDQSIEYSLERVKDEIQISMILSDIGIYTLYIN